MNANHELDRRLADFYAGEAPQRAPDRVLEGALASIDSTSQRRALVRVPWRIPTMDTAPQVSSRSMMTLPALLAITLVAVVLGGAAFVASGMPLPFVNQTPTASSSPTGPTASPSATGTSVRAIVVTDATLPTVRPYAVYRSLSGIDALKALDTVSLDPSGPIDAALTEFDDDDEHEGDHEGRYRTFAAAFETAVDAQRAFATAVATYEPPAGWGSAQELALDPPLGEQSVQLVTGSDYGSPRLKVLIWRIDRILLLAVDFHPYDRADRIDDPSGFLETIAAEMTVRAGTP